MDAQAISEILSQRRIWNKIQENSIQPTNKNLLGFCPVFAKEFCFVRDYVGVFCLMTMVVKRLLHNFFKPPDG